MLLPCLFLFLHLLQRVCGGFMVKDSLPPDTAQRLDLLERLVLDQEAEMSALKRLVREQADILRSQQDHLSRLQIECDQKSFALNETNFILSKLEHEIILRKQKDQISSTTQKDPHGHKRQESLFAHSRDVAQRAVEPGPLEAVVNQLSHQMTSTSADLQALKTSVSQQGELIQDARTSTFIRWGNSQCGSTSELVYSGVVGGSHFTDSGAATNYLCLTFSPVPADPETTMWAHLYGAEYETSDSFHEKDAVCAVCRTPFATTIMIPGTNVCTSGWHPQYSGYLMAGAFSHAAGSEFICVDSARESTAHSDANENGKLLYYTAIACGSLPCGPYVNGTTASCAVCSK